MDVEFIRVYNNNVYVVAEFEDVKSGRKFPLNASSLEERIRIREEYGRDTSTERMALSLIRGHKDYRAGESDI